MTRARTEKLYQEVNVKTEEPTVIDVSWTDGTTGGCIDESALKVTAHDEALTWSCKKIRSCLNEFSFLTAAH